MCVNCRLDNGANPCIPDSDGLTALHKAAQQARFSLLSYGCICHCLSATAKDEYYNPLTLKLERKMQKFDLRLSIC